MRNNLCDHFIEPLEETLHCDCEWSPDCDGNAVWLFENHEYRAGLMPNQGGLCITMCESCLQWHYQQHRIEAGLPY